MLLDLVNVCGVRVRNYTTASFFPFFFFLPLPVLKRLDFWAISKQIIDIFLQILDENGRDDT